MRPLRNPALVTRQNPKPHHLRSFPRNPRSNPPKPDLLISSESESSSPSNTNGNNDKKPLALFFKEAVGLIPRTEGELNGGNENESTSRELSARLTQLGREMRVLESRYNELKKQSKSATLRSAYGGEGNEEAVTRCNDEESKNGAAVAERRSEGAGKEEVVTRSNDQESKNGAAVAERRSEGAGLYDVFAEEGRRERAKRPPKDAIVIKEISADMEMFLTHLHKEGYFREANFLRNGKLDASCFEDSYSRDFVKYAAERFAKDHQEIAKWLSGRDLKNVALFGCPSVARKSVFSAKRLRNFFRIPEDTVCQQCVLRESCKFVNQSIWKSDTNNLSLATVIRVITLYGLELVPSQLKTTEELKVSVSRLLKDIVKLSQTVSKV